MSERHRWIERDRLHDRTRRQCDKCGLWKVTRHEPAARPQHWTEWYRDDGSRVPGDATPACSGVEARAGAAGASAPTSRDSASAYPSPARPDEDMSGRALQPTARPRSGQQRGGMSRVSASASTSKSDVGVCLSVPQTITD